MSVPARRVAEPTAHPAPNAHPARPARPARPAVRPARRSAPPAARPRTSVIPLPRARRRRAGRGARPAFFVLSAVVVTALVAAAVSLSAMLVQASFRVEALQAQVAELGDRGERLVTEVAELSSPWRVAGWAAGTGMVTPDDVVPLTLPREGLG